MHTPFARGLRLAAALALAVAGLAFAGAAAADNQYLIHNLVSDGALPADHVDANLVNAWGLTRSATSPWWVADNGSEKTTVYNGAGVLVMVGGLPFQGVPGNPTGAVFSGISGTFQVGTTASPTTLGTSNFIFSGEDGMIRAWRGGSTAALVTALGGSDAVFKGLALAPTVAAPLQGPLLYATDFHNGHVDVYNGQWQPVTVPGGFVDPNLPAGYAPFGIQAIGSRIFVTYAVQDAAGHDEVDGAGLGIVDAYDTAGNLLARVAQGGDLNAPWGLAQAPASFGAFGGDLLVGNFGDGRINAFQEQPDGSYRRAGTLQSASGGQVAIDGLWALEFGGGTANNGSTDTLYFTAGPNGENDGLFGTINAANMQCMNEQLSGTYRSVTVTGGSWCDLSGAHVTGNVQAQGTTGLRLASSTVGGNVQVQNITSAADPFSPGANAICSSTIGGNLQIQGSAAVSPWTIGPCSPTGSGNNIAGNVQFQNNAGSPNVISGNTIGGNLQCQNNGAVTTGGNTVHGKAQGQCAAP